MEQKPTNKDILVQLRISMEAFEGLFEDREHIAMHPRHRDISLALVYSTARLVEILLEREKEKVS